MAQPQVIIVPAHSGIGTNPPIQIPIGAGTVTVLNLDPNLGLTLCNTLDFATSSTWPLPPNISIPQTDVNNLWAQNEHSSDIEVLVIAGVVPITYVPISGNETLTVVGNETLSVDNSNAVAPQAGTSISLLGNTAQIMPSVLGTLEFSVTITTYSGTATFQLLFANTSNTQYSSKTTTITPTGVGQVINSSVTINGVSLGQSIELAIYWNTFTAGATISFDLTSATFIANAITISAPPPSANGVIINYSLSSVGSGTALVKDVAGNLLGSINLAQPIGSYSIDVPILVTSASMVITNSESNLNIISAYSHV